MSKRIITFGKWEEKPIEWIVLDEDEYQTFVVSRYPLFSHLFNSDSNKGNQWADSDIRKYLNDNFWNNAFTDEEKKKVINSSVKENADGWEKMSYIAKLMEEMGMRYEIIEANCQPSKDNVFLLSLIEAEKYLTSEERKFGDGTSCNGHNCKECYKYSDRHGTCWLLRSSIPKLNDYAVFVHPEGRFFCRGVNNNRSIRPALYLKSLR